MIAFSAKTGTEAILFYAMAYVTLCLPVAGVLHKDGRAWLLGFVPVVNVAMLCKVANLSPWWVVVGATGIGTAVLLVVLSIRLSSRFRHGGGFALGLIVLGWLFMMVLWLEGNAHPKTRNLIEEGGHAWSGLPTLAATVQPAGSLAFAGGGQASPIMPPAFQEYSVPKVAATKTQTTGSNAPPFFPAAGGVPS